MNEELIKRLREESENIGWSTKMLAIASLLDEAADALSRPATAVQVPDGFVPVRRKLIDESIARINCAIPGWETHVHALNDALAAAPSVPVAGVDVETAFAEWSEKRGVWPRLTHDEIFSAGWSAALLASAPAGTVGDGFISAGVVINNNQPGSQYIVEAPHGVTIPVGTEVFIK